MELVIPGSSGGRGPEAMHTDGDELIASANGLPEEAEFIGSGLVAARRPGMTLQRRHGSR
jgi:hypothetical protein